MTLVRKNKHSNPEVNSLLNDFFNEGFLNWPVSNGQKAWNHKPAVNISENEDQWTVDLAVPGMKKDNFKISLEEDTLTVKAEAEHSTSENKEHFMVKEFNYSSFERSFKLPENKIEQDSIKANYENGVLSISLPKKDEAKPQPKKEIAVA